MVNETVKLLDVKTRKRWLVGFEPSIFLFNSSRSSVSQIVSSVYRLPVLLVSFISRLYGAGNCWHRFSCVCSKAPSKLIRANLKTLFQFENIFISGLALRPAH